MLNEYIQQFNQHPYQSIFYILLMVFIMREINCWFFGTSKLNDIISRLDDIKNLLKNKK